MSQGHRWRDDQISNGNWIHVIGDETFVLKSYHNRVSWDQLPQTVKGDQYPSADTNAEDDNESSNMTDGEDDDSIEDSNQIQLSSQLNTLNDDSKSGDNNNSQSKNKDNDKDSTDVIPLDAEKHAILDFRV